MAINCPYYFFYNCVQNALKLAYVQSCTCQFKKLYGGYTPGPLFQRDGREGKREGGIRRNGRKETGRKDEGEGEGREKEGREDSL
jgi:hypothetical protein